LISKSETFVSKFQKYGIITSILILILILYLIFPDIVAVVRLLLSNPVAVLGTGLFKLIIFPGLIYISLVPLIAEWVERKIVAKMQVRVGPLYVGGWEGFLQPIADLLKLISKEIIIPKNADKLIFVLSPILVFIIGALPSVVVPYSPNYVIWNYEFGVLLFFAVLGFYPLAVLTAAWSSNNKYSFIGGLRALYQLASYEVPLFLATLPSVMLANSLSLSGIAASQSRVWFVAFAPISAVVFFVAMMAELERIPFDTPEADSELVTGWTTEYAGMAWGLLQFASYVKLTALSGVFVVLFLGGWQGPAFFPPVVWSLVKVAAVILILLLARGYYPRIRIDQLVRAGWGWLIPLCIVNILALVAFQPYLAAFVR
jgi:NADH-quinone oxidoreductase subunit H